MFEVITLEPQIIEIRPSGAFMVQHGKDYQHLIMDLLDKSEGLLYILSNFRKVTVFERLMIPEIGMGPHLLHRQLGFMALLGGDRLTNFVLSVVEARALKQPGNHKLRIHYNYDRALEMLRYFQGINSASQSQLVRSMRE